MDYATLQKKLSPFQLEKLTYLFRCLFDCNQDGVIDVSFKGSSFKNFKKSPQLYKGLFYRVQSVFFVESDDLVLLNKTPSSVPIWSPLDVLRQNEYLCDLPYCFSPCRALLSAKLIFFLQYYSQLIANADEINSF